MNRKTIDAYPDLMYSKIFFFLLLIALTASGASSEIIPTDRKIVWEGNVGVSGDIPATLTKIGSTLNATGSDQTSAINALVASCTTGHYVELGAGTFKISGTIAIKSNQVLRGAGKGITKLQATSGFSGNNGLVYVSLGGYSFSSIKSISSGATKSSQTIVTSASHGYSVGDYIYIDHLNDGTADPMVTNVGNGGTATWSGRSDSLGNVRVQGQINRVASGSSGTTINLEIPLYCSYTRTPEVCKMSTMCANAGIEDLTLDNSLKCSATIAQFLNAANCWIKNVELYGLERTGSNSSGVKLYQSYRCTVRGCTFHEPCPLSETWVSDDAYAIYLIPSASANLIENNEFHHVGLAVAFQGATGGNVFSYNYVHDLYHKESADASGSTVGCSICQHGGHSFMNLIEGNYLMVKYNADDFWGSSSHNTLFRNKIQNPPVGYGNARTAVDLAKQSSYTNVVGNILGLTGYETIYENIGDRSSADKAVYALGYSGSGDYLLANNDPKVKTTLLRHGNWDSVNKSIIWDPGITDQNLPASLYLKTKPSWYGGCLWPPINPAGPTVADIPAKLKSEGKSCPLLPGQNLRIVQ